MSSNFTLRKNVENLGPDELKRLKSAFRKIMRRGKSDRLGYHYLAGIHDVPDGLCWHSPREYQGYPDVALFLPWHRAYVYRLEKALQDEEPEVTLPYWDWRTDDNNARIPDIFSKKEDVDGTPNPFFNFHINMPEIGVNRDTERFPGQLPPTAGISLPTSKKVDDIIYDPDDSFYEFSERLRGIHNDIHVWTGGLGVWKDGSFGQGDMGVQNFASFDPIFWFHHCMVDKLWWMWQKRNGINNIPADWINFVLEPFELKVIDVLNIDELGYDYAEEGAVVGGNWSE